MSRPRCASGSGGLTRNDARSGAGPSAPSIIGRPAGRAPRTPGDNPTDIIFLVERLEALIAGGKKLPLTNSVVLDQTGVLDLVDQLRVAVPDEVRQARRITEEAGRIVDRARDEAAAIVDRAREQAAFMIEERELTRGAEQRARQILEHASQEAVEIRRGADEYAAGVLVRLEGECIKALTSIKRGIDMLDDRHRDAVPVAPDENGRDHAAPEREDQAEPIAARP